MPPPCVRCVCVCATQGCKRIGERCVKRAHFNGVAAAVSGTLRRYAARTLSAPSAERRTFWRSSKTNGHQPTTLDTDDLLQRLVLLRGSREESSCACNARVLVIEPCFHLMQCRRDRAPLPTRVGRAAAPARPESCCASCIGAEAVLPALHSNRRVDRRSRRGDGKQRAAVCGMPAAVACVRLAQAAPFV